jgi:hypothetical protein
MQIKPWVKRNNNSVVAMGSFDGADVCELIDLFALNTLTKKFGKENIGWIVP